MRFYKFPTAIKKLTGVQAVNGIDFNGFKWKVGQISQGVEFIYDIDDLVTYYPLFVKYLHLEKQENVSNIAVSLPLDTYLKSLELKKANQENLIDKLANDIISKVDECNQCLVLPQGLSALYKINKEDKLNGNILVIDGGFNTVNIAIAKFISDSNLDILFSHTIFDELGVRDLLENFFRKELEMKFNNVTSNLQVLNSIFNAGTIDNGLNTVNITNEKKRAVELFTNSLFDRIVKIVQKSKVQFDSIVVVGGLSYYIKINSNKKTFIPKNDGEFYTVMGMIEKIPDGFLALDLGFGDAKIAKKD